MGKLYFTCFEPMYTETVLADLVVAQFLHLAAIVHGTALHLLLTYAGTGNDGGTWSTVPRFPVVESCVNKTDGDRINGARLW